MEQTWRTRGSGGKETWKRGCLRGFGGMALWRAVSCLPYSLLSS